MAITRAERKRRRDLLQMHLDAEAAADLDAIMATFAPDAENFFNQNPIVGLEAIANAHAGFGFDKNTPGALEGIVAFSEQEYFSEHEIILRGRLKAKHVGVLAGVVPPSNVRIVLPFVSAYRYNAAGLLISERVVMNLAPFVKPE